MPTTYLITPPHEADHPHSDCLSIRTTKDCKYTENFLLYVDHFSVFLSENNK